MTYNHLIQERFSQKRWFVCNKIATFTKKYFSNFFNVKKTMNLQSQVVSKIKRLRHEKGFSQP
jgi:hypothetical protein